jgi:hypothetical protein
MILAKTNIQTMHSKLIKATKLGYFNVFKIEKKKTKFNEVHLV